MASGICVCRAHGAPLVLEFPRGVLRTLCIQDLARRAGMMVQVVDLGV